MLDVIADFWKPVKKAQQQDKIHEDQLQIGSSIGFGFVPQALLTGRRVVVSSINTYQFGLETLTSYILSQDKEPSISMIVADADGEQYLAISRRIPLEERSRLFDNIDLESCISNPDVTRLACKDNVPEFKTWLVNSYKREINGLKGKLYKGDFRKVPLPATSEGRDFTYTLLVSDSNEHALEIEKYVDGRIEVYATIYRRVSDIGEVAQKLDEVAARPDIKLVDPNDTATLVEKTESVTVSEPKAESPKAESPKAEAPKIEAPKAEAPKIEAPKAEAPKAEVTMVQQPVQPRPTAQPEAKSEVILTPKANAAPAQSTKAPDVVFEASEVKTTAVKVSEVKAEIQQGKEKTAKADIPPTQPTAPVAAHPTKPAPTAQNTINKTEMQKENATMSTQENTALYVHSNTEEANVQTLKAVPTQRPENDSVECDLRVANKIIDEAIRSEMRLTDVVRRVIELPVAYPEAVQIPVTLKDEDYSLLSIRYGIPVEDREAIKQRIAEDLVSFADTEVEA